jgi:hypothetical protein
MNINMHHTIVGTIKPKNKFEVINYTATLTYELCIDSPGSIIEHLPRHELHSTCLFTSISSIGICRLNVEDQVLHLRLVDI